MKKKKKKEKKGNYVPSVDVAPLVGPRLEHQKVVGSIPGQGV